MNKMTAQFSRNHEKMKQSNAIIRNGIIELITSLITSSFFTIKTNSRNWIFVAVRTPSTSKITANKNIEIIIRLNDKKKKQQLSEREIKRIVVDINACITKQDIQIKKIRAIKKLSNENLTIHAISAKEANKLKNNNTWTAVLERKTKTVVHIFAIMMSEMEIKKFDLFTTKERETAIRKIKKKNANVEKLREMKILYLFWRNKFTIVQQYHTLIIEMFVFEMNNNMLNNNIMIEEKLKICSIFNKACKSIQCYKCHHHEHTTIQCTKKNDANIVRKHTLRDRKSA